MNTAANAKRQLRAHFRSTRCALSPSVQRRHAWLLARHAKPLLDRHSCARNVAVYLEFDGEVGTLPLIHALRRRGKRVFVPVIHGKCMRFASLDVLGATQDTPLKPQSAFSHRRLIAPAELDLVFLPLVAFDAQGVRLGMGGGFYDRCFAFKRNAPGRKPLLVGVAHQSQQAGFGVLPREKWDLRLDWHITESGLRKCMNRSS